MHIINKGGLVGAIIGAVLVFLGVFDGLTKTLIGQSELLPGMTGGWGTTPWHNILVLVVVMIIFYIIGGKIYKK